MQEDDGHADVSDEAEQAHLILGTVLQGASPFSVGNVNTTFRGPVLCADGETRQAIIKDLSPRQLANEAMAAALGLASGLPVPPSIIAKAEPGVIPVSQCPLTDGSGHLVFGSADMLGSSVQQIYLGDPTTVTLIRERLAGWSEIGSLYGFDTWIANTDRHAGNLLFSGHQEIWLIDHGHSFTGPEWEPVHLRPDEQYANRLSEWLTPMMSEDQRRDLAAPASTLPGRLETVELSRLGELNHVADLLTAGDFDALVDFLDARVRHVPRLASEALGLLV